MTPLPSTHTHTHTDTPTLILTHSHTHTHTRRHTTVPTVCTVGATTFAATFQLHSYIQSGLLSRHAPTRPLNIAHTTCYPQLHTFIHTQLRRNFHPELTTNSSKTFTQLKKKK